MFAIGLTGGFFATFAIAMVVLLANTSSAAREAEEATQTPVVVAESLSGAEISANNGCAACHTTDGTQVVGPTWQGLFGSTRTFDDGTQVTADAAYLRMAIVDPRADIVEGFGAVMPEGYGDRLSDAEIDALIAYIESLG